jgi:hypothetical protein
MASSPSIYHGDVLHPLIFVFAGLLVVVLSTHASRKRGALPPGPKPLPVIGNLVKFPSRIPASLLISLQLDIPTSEEWLTWQKHVQSYGDLVYLTALGRDYLLLGSQAVIVDLVEKRSHFNDRPYSTMILEL